MTYSPVQSFRYSARVKHHHTIQRSRSWVQSWSMSQHQESNTNDCILAGCCPQPFGRSWRIPANPACLSCPSQEQRMFGWNALVYDKRSSLTFSHQRPLAYVGQFPGETLMVRKDGKILSFHRGSLVSMRSKAPGVASRNGQKGAASLHPRTQYPLVLVFNENKKDWKGFYFRLCINVLKSLICPPFLPAWLISLRMRSKEALDVSRPHLEAWRTRWRKRNEGHLRNV